MSGKTSVSDLQKQLNRYKAPVKRVEEPKEEEQTRYVDDTNSLFETDTSDTMDNDSVDASASINRDAKIAFEEAESVSKKTANVSVERYLAILMKHGLRIGTAYLFKPHNAMNEVEAGSTTIPTIRMLQRRIDKWLKVTLPFNRMDKADKADVEEIVTAVGNYLIRISAQAIDRWVARLTNKQPRPITMVRPQSHAPLTPHERNVQAHMQANRNMRPIADAMPGAMEMDLSNSSQNGQMTQEQKEALIAMYAGIDGLEG